MGEGGGMGRIEEKETSAQDEPTNLTPPNLGTVILCAAETSPGFLTYSEEPVPCSFGAGSLS